MAGMLDKLFEEKAEKIKKDFDKRLSEHEKNLKVQLDRLEKKMDDMAACVK
jgi:flagellar capping protein FliD